MYELTLCLAADRQKYVHEFCKTVECDIKKLNGIMVKQNAGGYDTGRGNNGIGSKTGTDYEIRRHHRGSSAHDDPVSLHPEALRQGRDDRLRQGVSGAAPCGRLAMELTFLSQTYRV